LIAMDLAEVIAAAFMAGVKQQAKAEGKKAGKKTVKYVVKDLPGDTVAGVKGALRAEKKVVRKASAYSKKYGRAFKSIAGQYKTKSGSWKKDGFKRAQKAAHKKAKTMR
tara:strand:+ start:704 stop:1030 length:327 start_codon:yes stop_codon:yes gene_type:complete